MHGPLIKWNFMTDGFFVFLIFYTHRTNSVEQFGTSTLSWREKVSFCEQEYARLGSPAIFKISPLVSPDFDYVLENRGYEIQHTTNVMAADLEHADLSASYDLVTLTDDIPDIWIESLFRFKGNHKSGSPGSGSFYVSCNCEGYYLCFYLE